MIGYQSGRNVKLKVDEARQRIAKMIDANQQAVFPEKEITFTSGGTESNYLAMHSSIFLLTEDYIMHPVFIFCILKLRARQ